LCLFNKVIVALIPVIQTVITADFVNTVLGIYNGEIKKGAIYLPLFYLICIILYTYVNGTLIGFAQMKLEIKLMESIQTSVIEKRSKLDYWLIEHNDTWDLIHLVCNNSSDRIKKGYFNLLDAGTNLVRVISILVLLFYQIWWSAILMFILFLPLFVVMLRSGKSNYKAIKEANKIERKADYLRNVLQGRESVEERSLFGFSKQINDKWYESYESARAMEKLALVKNTLSVNATGISTIIIALILIGSLLKPLGNGTLSIGMFIGFVPSIFNLVRTMSKEFTQVTINLANDLEYIKDLKKFMELPETDGALDLPNETIRKIDHITIKFINVTFCYPGTNRTILKNLTMTLYPNRHYALVGLNGAGKSTITKLLTGLYTNYTGEILLGDKNIKDFSLAELKGLFGSVYQDFARYSIPLKDSILLGNIRKLGDLSKLTKVIDDMDLKQITSRLSNGFETPIGKIFEGGTDLSGGEWQRVAIARTLVNDAKILILDEPTAALDPVAESNIYELFHRISMGKSAIFITHRLGAAKLTDEILVIDDGTVKEQGTHDELMERNGIYCNLYHKQRSWYQ
jgi:ATP-binding cassette subfamily B protein